jgi:hypothetical protein
MSVFAIARRVRCGVARHRLIPRGHCGGAAPAGGSVDGVARILVQKSTRRWGSISSSRIALAARPERSAPTPSPSPHDGYTLLLSASVHVINPFLCKSVPMTW